MKMHKCIKCEQTQKNILHTQAIQLIQSNGFMNQCTANNVYCIDCIDYICFLLVLEKYIQNIFVIWIKIHANIDTMFKKEIL